MFLITDIWVKILYWAWMCWSRQDNSHWSFNWGACEPLYTREIELIQDRMREFWKFRDISRSYMLINGHRDRTFYQFPYSSMTFHVLPWVIPVRSTTFQSVPRPSSQFYDLFQQNVWRLLGRRGGAEVIALRNGKTLTSKTRRKHVVWRVPVWVISLILSVRTIHVPVKDIPAWTQLKTRISVLVPFPLALTGRIR